MLKHIAGIALITSLFISAAPAASIGSPVESISWNSGWTYADKSEIHSDTATLYHSITANAKNITVCVNAGHGTTDGQNHKTLCHPDGSPKCTGGTTGQGAVYSTSVSVGTTFLDGTSESDANLQMAKILKDLLLQNGYNVLMLRENNNTQLDNIARSVIANHNAQCHIALHYDSTINDKGAFCITVPDIPAYKDMEPVKSHWQQHQQLADSLIQGMQSHHIKLFSNGTMDLDLTQLSYSTIPSIDLELGDRASDHSPAAQKELAQGIVTGLNIFFQQK